MATAEERIATLEARVDELASHVTSMRRDSMHKTLTCPACGCGTIFLLRQVQEYVKSGDDQMVVPLALGSTSDLGPGDPLCAYVCRDCRLVEFHTQTLARLFIDRENVDILQREPPATTPSDTPYR
jgi:hypothetical protein